MDLVQVASKDVCYMCMYVTSYLLPWLHSTSQIGSTLKKKFSWWGGGVGRVQGIKVYFPLMMHLEPG